jgi:hypothetical protein
MYGIYEDSDLTQLISAEGSLSNPDEETDLNGDDGETAVKALWAACIQTELAAPIDDSTQTVTVDASVFKYTDEPVLKCGSELMYITAGFGTTTLTVERGWNNTTPASHSENDRIYMAYNAEGVYVACEDNEQVISGDESSWVTYCLDDGGGSPDGSYSAVLSLGNIDYDDAGVAFHRKVVVPASTDAQSKQDLIHQLCGSTGVDSSFKLVPLDS